MGIGTLRRVPRLLESEYDDVLAQQKKIDALAAETLNDDSDPEGIPSQQTERDPGWSKPVIGPIGQAMFAASKPIQIQANQQALLDAMFNDAKRAHGAEQAAYLVYSFPQGTLSIVRGTNRAPADRQRTEGKLDLGGPVPGAKRASWVLPGDHSKVVIGTIHTHWDDAGREKPEVSRHTDVPEAGAKKIVVYAIDRNFLHRADPDGIPHDRLPRNLMDVLSPALRIYGKTF